MENGQLDIVRKSVANALKIVLDSKSDDDREKFRALFSKLRVKVKDSLIQVFGFSDFENWKSARAEVIRALMESFKNLGYEVKIDPTKDPDSISLTIMVDHDHEEINEVAVMVFKRDPKTNKMKRAYKCIGGLKNGRRVMNPDECLGKVNIQKRINMAITRRKNRAASNLKRKKTKMVNIVSKRTAKANKRIKKARGF